MAGGLMSNEVRPPIDIGGSNRGRPGPLDPDENRPRSVPQGSIQRSGGSGGGTSWMPAIIAIVVSVIASAVMVFMFNPAKAGVETLSNQVIQLDQRMSTMEGYATKIDKIDDIDTSLNQLLATSAGYVTQSDLAGITDGMATGDDVATLQASIDALTTENSALADRITELETEEEQATEEENSVSTEAQVWIDLGYNERFDWEDDDGDTLSWLCTQDLAFEIINESSNDIEDIEIEIVIHSQGSSMHFDSSSNAVYTSGGYPLDLRVVHVDSSVIVLNGSTPSWSDGLVIDAEDDENIYFSLIMPCTSEPDSSRLYVEAEVTDFKIVE